MFDALMNFLRYATTRSGRTIAALEDENATLRDQLAQRVIDDAYVTGLCVTNGRMTMGFKGGALQLLAESFAHQFVESGAVNYLEAHFKSRTIAPDESFVVTMQKCKGKTPHQLRLAAEEELAKLRATLPANADVSGLPRTGDK